MNDRPYLLDTNIVLALVRGNALGKYADYPVQAAFVEHPAASEHRNPRRDSRAGKAQRLGGSKNGDASERP